MRLGIKEVRDFFFSQDVKWFDTKEIRNYDSLSEEEIRYIKGWTIAPLGYGFIFYLTKRRLPDLLTLYFFNFLLNEIPDSAFDIPKPYGLWSALTVLILTLYSLLMIASWVYVLYFTYRHGRRLSWNRGRYVFVKFLGYKLSQFSRVEEYGHRRKSLLN